ncbi:MAG: hypothetical protein O3C40_27860 [Planctomycetota bacterium]|nr:hypothetical protein [Planctomycetota bacterium]
MEERLRLPYEPTPTECVADQPNAPQCETPDRKQHKPIIVRMRQLAHDRLRLTVGSLPAERGGIFVSRQGPLLIDDFVFDDSSDTSRAVYYPNADYLNTILERDYEPKGFCFVGVGHSHPRGLWRPSGDAGWGDVKAARSNLLSKSNADLAALFIPIIESHATTGRFRLHPFVMLRADLQVHPARVEIVD